MQRYLFVYYVWVILGKCPAVEKNERHFSCKKKFFVMIMKGGFSNNRELQFVECNYFKSIRSIIEEWGNALSKTSNQK